MSDFLSDDALNEAMSVIELQDNLMSLDDEGLSDCIDYILQSNYCKDIDELTDSILLSVQFRPNNTQIYLKLVEELISKADDTNNLSEIPQSLLRQFVPFKVKYYFYISFIQKCYFRKIIPEEMILHKIQAFFNEYGQEVMPSANLIFYFAPLVSEKMGSLYAKKIELFKNIIETFNNFYEIKNFLVRDEYFKTNNWEPFYQQAETNYPLDSIQTIIKNDDIEVFQKKVAESNLDINQETKVHSYENIAIPEVNPTLLQLAAYYGSMKIFKYILLNGAKLNIMNREGFSFEHFAIAGGDSEMIHIFEEKQFSFKKALKTAALFHQNQIFDWINETKEQDKLAFLDAAASNNIYVMLHYIEEGIDVNIQDDDERTALHFAAQNGSNDAIKLLLAHKDIDVNKGVDNRTALDNASVSGLLDTLKLLLAVPGIMINEIDRSGNTPFGNAVLFNHIPIAKELSKMPGIDINKYEQTRFAPIQTCITRDYYNMLEFIIGLPGIDLSVKDDWNNSLLHLACFSAKNPEILMLLLKHPLIRQQLTSFNAEQNTPLHLAAQDLSPKYVSVIVDFLLNNENAIQGFDINARNENKQTPLHIAADQGSPISIQYLMRMPGRDINAKDFDDMTPLHYAAKKCNAKLISELLADPNIDVNCKNSNEQAPLHLAVDKATKEGLEALLSHPNIDVNARDISGETPLLTALKKFHPENIDILLNFPQVNLSAVDNTGQNAFHKAAQSTKPRMLEKVLKKCENILDINSRDNLGATPLHFAAKGKSSDVIKTLLKVENIDVNAVDNNGETPLHYASRSGILIIVSTLLSAPGINKEIANKRGQLPIDVITKKPTRGQIENLLKQ